LIRYTFITLLLLLVAFAFQQFLPVFTGWNDSRILIVQLVFLCCSITVGMPVMLSLAFLGGVMWDAQFTLGPHGGDPSVYTQSVENLRFGYSILIFGVTGLLMQGVRPFFKQGKWRLCSLLAGLAVLVYLSTEYAIINFIRGEFTLTPATVKQIIYSSLLTMLFAPPIFICLMRIARACDHTINPDAGRRRSAR
jgi:cell shape-determining protein MreD